MRLRETSGSFRPKVGGRKTTKRDKNPIQKVIQREKSRFEEKGGKKLRRKFLQTTRGAGPGGKDRLGDSVPRAILTRSEGLVTGMNGSSHHGFGQLRPPATNGI